MSASANPLCWACNRPMGGLAPTTRLRNGTEVHLRCADSATKKLRVLNEAPAWIVQGLTRAGGLGGAGAGGPLRGYWTWQMKGTSNPQHYACVVLEVTKGGYVKIELADGYIRAVPAEAVVPTLPATAEVNPGRPRVRG